MFKEFFRNPIQKKFLPVLAALLQLVVFTAITHKPSSVIVPLLLVLAQLVTADQPIRKPWMWVYVGWAALFTASAIMMVFVQAWLAAVVAGIVALYPLSILFTRPVVD